MNVAECAERSLSRTIWMSSCCYLPLYVSKFNSQHQPRPLSALGAECKRLVLSIDYDQLDQCFHWHPFRKNVSAGIGFVVSGPVPAGFGSCSFVFFGSHAVSIQVSVLHTSDDVHHNMQLRSANPDCCSKMRPKTRSETFAKHMLLLVNDWPFPHLRSFPSAASRRVGDNAVRQGEGGCKHLQHCAGRWHQSSQEVQDSTSRIIPPTLDSVRQVCSSALQGTLSKNCFYEDPFGNRRGL